MSHNLEVDELDVFSILSQRGVRPNGGSTPAAAADEATGHGFAVGADELRVRAYLCRLGAVL